MRVRALADMRPYFNYQVHPVKAGDEVDGGLAEYLANSGDPVEILGETPEPDPDVVPDGTADEVLAWVGDDQTRAAEALDAENTREKPRSTLAAKLAKITE